MLIYFIKNERYRKIHTILYSMNLILDLDGTLIDSNNNSNQFTIYPRPYLDVFFSYIFENFSNICIWTHSTEEWYFYVYDRILKNYIPNGKEFSLVLTRNKNLVFTFPRPKPLEYLYKLYPDKFNKDNTFIIDDTPATYMYNEKNAIPINTYYKENLGTDRKLLDIIIYLESLKV